MVPLSRRILLGFTVHVAVLQPQKDKSSWFGLIRFRSPLLTESLLLSFPGGTEMFQFPPLASYAYGFSVR